MIQVALLDVNEFYIGTDVVDKVGANMTAILPTQGFIKAQFLNGIWQEGATAEEIAEWQANKIDICALKEKKIQESKEQLATWLANNPMLSEIHNPEGEHYTVTQEKQAQLTQLLTLYSMAKPAGTEMQLTWNASGGVCEEWTYEQLSTLSFQIASYVLPRVKKQQQLEVQINSCNTEKELNEIEIEYDTI